MTGEEVYPQLCRVCRKPTYPDPDQLVCDKCIRIQAEEREEEERAGEPEYNPPIGRSDLITRSYEDRVHNNIHGGKW